MCMFIFASQINKSFKPTGPPLSSFRRSKSGGSAARSPGVHPPAQARFEVLKPGVLVL